MFVNKCVGHNLSQNNAMDFSYSAVHVGWFQGQKTRKQKGVYIYIKNKFKKTPTHTHTALWRSLSSFPYGTFKGRSIVINY